MSHLSRRHLIGVGYDRRQIRHQRDPAVRTLGGAGQELRFAARAVEHPNLLCSASQIHRPRRLTRLGRSPRIGQLVRVQWVRARLARVRLARAARLE